MRLGGILYINVRNLRLGVLRYRLFCLVLLKLTRNLKHQSLMN